MMISAEYRLLIAAATPHPHPAPVLVPAGIDWELALSLAAHHGLLGLLARHLRATGAFAPERFAARLATERQRIAAEELLARRQLIEVAEVLAGAGVRTVAFKGAAMIEQVYEQPGLRPMVDLDLLIAREHLPAAVGALRAAGYRAHPWMGGERRALTSTPSSHHHHHAPLLHPDQPFSIELHHRITGVCAANSTERIVDRALPSSHGAYLLPRPADHVISLAAHYINDRLPGSKRALGQLADLAHTVARYPPDWTLLASDARAYGTSARLFLALDALSTLGLATVPADALEALAPAEPSEMLSQRLLAERVLVAAPVRSLAALPTLRHALLPGRQFMQDRYGLPGASLARLYLERTRTSARIIMSRAGQPASLVTDATLDRSLKHTMRR